ncbi:MAG TPA: hypothetical protein VK530_11310 [Candidatus Acidoferrum sp.]|nr:hypothetical protein [Candidatus Acidoferrum sp.]
MFVAQENMRLYIEKFGVDRVGLLTITVPGECLSARDFQSRWHSFRTNVLVKLFKTGMWVRERQIRTGNLHAHAVVNLGRDVRTSFPFEEVQQGFYANVDAELRSIWKQLRERAKGYGFGRTELLPVKRTGAGCARYLTKYLGKAFVSEKCVGEERCRLFGVWGGVRFVHARFDWASSRIMRRRKQWLAETAQLVDTDGFRGLYGNQWWFVIGDALMKVILPIQFYQIEKRGKYEWDDLGWFAYQADLGRYPDLISDDARRRRSLFDFYCVEGAAFDMAPGQAARYAMGRIGYLEQNGRQLDPQILLRLETAIEQTARNCSP